MPPISTVKAYVQLTRPQNISGSVLTFFIGYLLVTKALDFDFFVGLLILLALHALATVQNDIEDFDIDRANKRSSGLQDHSLTIKSARFFVQALAFLAVLLAALSPHKRLHLTVILGLLITAWLYNANPVRASKRPLQSIFIMGICYGLFPFAYGYFLAGGNPKNNFFSVFCLMWLLARVSNAIMKDYKDAPGDKNFHKDTFYLHYGRSTTAWTSIMTICFAYLGILILVMILKVKTLLAAIPFLLAFLLAARNVIHRLSLLKARRESDLNSIFHQSVFNHNQFEAAILLCLILSSK